MNKKKRKVKVSTVYDKAPILEAVIDFAVQFSENIEFESFKKILGTKFEKHFNNHKIIRQMSLEGRFSAEKNKFSTSDENIGIQYFNVNQKEILLAKINGFTFSQKGPYDKWSTFRDNAKKFWDIYQEALCPAKVNRVALRYINQIDIPSRKFDMKEYFLTYPKIFGDDSKVEINNMFMQLQIAQKQGGLAIISQSIGKPATPGTTPIILDIDVHEFVEFDQPYQKMWNRVELLRKQKNKIFEESITPKTRELFL